MKPIDYMAFVYYELDRRFGNINDTENKEYTAKLLANKSSQPHSNSITHISLHDEVLLGRLGPEKPYYLCEIYWGATEKNNVPKKINDIVGIIERDAGKIRMYLSIKKRNDFDILEPSIVFNEYGKIICAEEYKPKENESLEESVIGILNLLIF